MKFYGFQKMTMLDFPGRVACIVFTGGCNFRCPFCHNSLLVTDIGNQTYDEEEILEYLNKRKGILDGICVSGGEPLLQVGLDSFLEKVKNMGVSVKIDTNGSFPSRLKTLVLKGLVDYVAMDIKNSKEKYPITTDCKNLDISKIEESVDFLLSGAVDYEFRTTVVNEFHKPQDIVAIGKWIQGAKKYFLQNFVDSGNLIGDGLSAVSLDKLKEFAEIAKPYVEKIALRGV
ncbi:MAG: anaerobic ribonucleoside-triphosphate reductase activating protein [Clostridiales bacterium]|nr:anaerobic ribonucleoside-triphosphate reductase activating protein [Clostridiales bacterium]